MKILSLLLRFVLAFCLIILGIVIDRAIKFYPFLVIDREVNIIDALSLAVTTIIAVSIPFFITKIIEDNRSIKHLLTQEIKDLLITVDSIKKLLDNAYLKSIPLTNGDKRKIVNLFHTAEMQVDSINTQCGVGFNKKSDSLNQKIESAIITYQDSIIGGNFMNTTFVQIDDSFYQISNTSFLQATTTIKVAMHSMHKL